MKVYIVTSGEYSDYGIDAVFLDKKEAELYIATHQKMDGYVWSWEEYNDILEFDTEDGKINAGDNRVGHFYWHDGYSIRHAVVFEVDAPRKAAKLKEKVSIWLPEENEAKAEKILHDRIAEMKAREAGIS